MSPSATSSWWDDFGRVRGVSSTGGHSDIYFGIVKKKNKKKQEEDSVKFLNPSTLIFRVLNKVGKDIAT